MADRYERAKEILVAVITSDKGNPTIEKIGEFSKAAAEAVVKMDKILTDDLNKKISS